MFQAHCTSSGTHLLKSLFKESCRLPVRILLHLMQSKMGFTKKCYTAPNTTITMLPNEVIAKIFSYCDDDDLAALRLQCVRFNEVGYFIDEYLWRRVEEGRGGGGRGREGKEIMKGGTTQKHWVLHRKSFIMIRFCSLRLIIAISVEYDTLNSELANEYCVKFL
ncbi:unnamed protein product [Toxocara canis]|uniref:F-box domain-containing protein n=1 Tax=Toxocara canis TaxID=6265 RepID=A0A183V169_TOXCA|nr:unnamed protein product [Toxocara canis]